MRVQSWHVVYGLLWIPMWMMTSCEEFVPEYSIGFYNVTNGRITEVRADWQADGRGHHELAGTVGVGDRGTTGKVSHEQPRPIPDKVMVTWKTADGKVHDKEVEVKKKISNPPKFSGAIFFKFTPDGDVKVVPLTYAEERKAAEQGKSALGESR